MSEKVYAKPDIEQYFHNDKEYQQVNFLIPVWHDSSKKIPFGSFLNSKK